MRSTMMDFPLTIGHVLRHGAQVHASSTVTTWSPSGLRRSSFADIAVRAGQLATLLKRLGVQQGDVVGTLAWNHQAHFEAYLAVPAMGAVLHTLNLRLSPEQLAYVINHGEDKVLLVDASLLPLLLPISDQLICVEHIIVIGENDEQDTAFHNVDVHCGYDGLVDAEQSDYGWPEIDERSAAMMCYTSGTTGNSKGVVYSHRSQVLHTLSVLSAANFAITEEDKVLVLVPLFHASAWGMPYAAWWAGGDLIFPQQHMQAEHVASMITDEKATFSAAVPTLWNDLLAYAERIPIDLSSLREIVSGGSAVPRGLIKNYRERFNIPMTQGWGMTECSPLAALARPPADVTGDAEFDFRARTGRVIPGIELRLVSDEGDILPWDGKSMGEINLRGSWVTGSYHKGDDPDKFSGGWLKTGDIGVVTSDGYIQLVDRSKDVIKSGGEWISSVALENMLMEHDDVLEAAVVAIEDDRWGERPLACIVAHDDRSPSTGVLREWLSAKFPAWQVPEYWAFCREIPRTSVGKFDKKEIRRQKQQGTLNVLRG